MKSQLNYTTKRKIIIIAVIVALLLIASIGTYVYFKGNDSTQATQMNSISEDNDEEKQQVADAANGSTSDGTQTTDNAESRDSGQETDTQSNTTSTDSSTTIATRTIAGTTTNITTETTTQTYETLATVVGFYSMSGIEKIGALTANYISLEKELVATTDTGSNYVKTGSEITYEINIKNNGSSLTGIEASMIIPDGVSLVAGSISDNGTEENGKITWTIDIDTEKTVSFTVEVTETSESGTIEAVAVVDGKNTNTVENEIDNSAPEIASLGIYNYTTNTSGKGTYAKQLELYDNTSYYRSYEITSRRNRI